MRIMHPALSRLLAVLALLLATAAHAEEAARQTLRYQIEVAGVKLGRIEVRASEAEDRVEARVGWEMKGFLGLLPRGEGDLSGEARIAAGEVLPASFHGTFEKPDRKREVRIRYTEAGAIRDVRLTNNGRKRSSEVPERLQEDTVDTLTAFWRLRRWAVEAEDEAIVVPVFDGRRRYDLEARRLGAEARDGGPLRIELTLVPRAGFDDDRVFGSRVVAGEPWAELVVSDDAEPVPLAITGLGSVPWRITLAE